MVTDMREMKDSGIEWASKIPLDWDVKRIKYLMTEKKIKTNNGSEERALSVTQNKGIIKSVDATVANPSSSYDDYVEIKAGDIVFNKYKAHSGVFFVSPYDGIVTFNYSVYKCNSLANPKFCELLFKTEGCIAEFRKRLHGVGESISPLYTKDLFDIPIIVPPRKKQDDIVSFLDTKCSEIDALSADIQSEIDTLQAYKKSVITEAVTKGLDKNAPMKDSGLPWVGEMPSHWELVRGKYCLKYLQKPIRQDDGVITCFRDGEVTLRSKRREEGFTMSDKEIGYQGIDEGDLVVHGMDGFAGAIGISDSRGKASPVLNVLDTEENKKYFMYYLRSMAYGDVFLALATGIRVRSCDLRWNKLAELSYPIPPKDEQDAIVAYIDNQLQRADEIIKDKQEQLEVLADYKKSVIYEYVTGKKEV